jgi:hypothetical protein
MTTTTPDKELRQYSRVPFAATALLHLPDRTISARLIDIALKGALIQTENPQTLVLAEPCRLVLALSQEGDEVAMAGKIVHMQGCHVGIECLDIELSSLALLRRLLELNTGDAELLNRELTHLLGGR